MAAENKFIPIIPSQNKRPEFLSAAFGRGKSTNEDFFGLLTFNLQPVAVSCAAAVSAVGFFGNHSFEPKFFYLHEKCFSFFKNMIVIFDVFGFYQSLFQKFFPLKKTEVFRRVPIKPEKIENLVNDIKVRIFANALQPLEIWFSFVVISNKFSVQNHFVLLKFQ